MNRRLRRGAGALALVLLAGGQVHGPALAQGERPDLKIEVVGLKPNSQREVLVRVTNVGQWWADRTTATVEAVPATAGAKVTEQVPDLGPEGDPETASRHEFTFDLAAPCGGQKVEVKAVLSAAKTFNGNTEANADLANNAHTREVCAAGAGPEDEVIVDIGACPGCAVPEHQKPGLHGDGGPWPALVLAPSVARSPLKQADSGTCTQFAPARPGLHVGWYQNEGDCFLGDSSLVQVAQTAVNFDLSKLDEVPAKTLKSAVLTFNERAASWRNGEGGFQEKGGCVEVLGRATEPWGGRDLGSLFPNEKVQGHTPGVKEWFVTDEVRQWVQNLRPRHGFVLRGGNENPRGEDKTSCMSEISGITLKLTYEVRW
jgi:hypothetical protein